MTAGSATRPLRVALQQRHELFRSGLALLLRASPAVEVVGTVTTAGQLIGLCDRARPTPDVALMDSGGNEVELAAVCGALRARRPALRLVALEPAGERCSLPAGCFDAVVERSAGVAAIVERLTSLQQVLPAPGVMAGRPRARASRAVLSVREIQVLTMLGRGATVRTVSERLDISAKTVEDHKRRIFEKLGVQNQAHAVSVALCGGLLLGDTVVARH